MSKIILLDGDVLVYQIGFSVESPIYVVGGNIYTRKGYAKRIALQSGKEVFKRKNIGNFQQVRYNLNAKLKMIYDDLGTRDYRMYITASNVKNNFRGKIGTLLPYKGNRVDTNKPFYYKKIRDMLLEDYKAIMVTGQEADDAVGIEQYNLYNQNKNFEGSYIASIDKDLKVLEGYHYHLNNRSITYVEQEEAIKNFCGQLLKGDSTDNIPGLSKILKLNNRIEEANKLIYSHYIKDYELYKLDHTGKECYNYIVSRYNEFGLGEDEIKEIGRLLWIRRKENEDWWEEYGKKGF